MRNMMPANSFRFFFKKMSGSALKEKFDTSMIINMDSVNLRNILILYSCINIHESLKF